MDWELVYLSMFRCVVHENGDKEAIEIASHQELGTSDESLQLFLESMHKQIKAKRPSLAPTASCRAFKFQDEEIGKADQKIVDQLLNAVSISSFEAHARILAHKIYSEP